MEIKDELALNDMTWAESDKIEYNTIGTFQTSDSNKPATVTNLGIIFFDGQVMHIPYRNNIHVMHLIIKL